jgi:ABC-2 type transport system ATP-binding protein
VNTEFAVTVQNLVVAFGNFKAVNDVSFEVRRGEIFGFLGANGAGKTTTIRVLCGLLPPSGGRVVVEGADPAIDSQAVKSHVGYMSQKFTLYRDMTIGENLQFAGHLRRMEESKISARVKELMAFIELDWPMKTKVCDLPAGVLQQIALVAATIHDPEIVFLDEPTAGVTPHARSRFWELIGALSKKGKTVFVTTHYMDEAEQCDRVALMRSGELIALGSPEDLKEKSFPDPMYEIFPSKDATPEWRDDLVSHQLVKKLDIFGMRYHAQVHDAPAFEDHIRDVYPGFQCKRTKPSLEDVFIELVEGKNRWKGMLLSP